MDTFDAGEFEILVGRSARENDRLTLEADTTDLWLHAAGYAGSHVLIRARQGKTGEVPHDVVERAATLAVWHSKARAAGGKVAVHVSRARDVSKRSGAPAGQVVLRQYETVRVYPREP
ncbi:MAG: NFACT RNA binding domain-containing protein [Gemmatimonadota bacterium]